MATPDDDYMETLLADMQKAEDDRVEAAQDALRRQIIPRLKKRGVTTVQASYSGYCDSGCIETVDYFDATNQPVTIRKGRSGIDASVDDVLHGFLPRGYEINDGGQGDITIDVQAGTVTLEHQENFVEHDDTTMGFTL